MGRRGGEGRGRRRAGAEPLDRELADLPEGLRWREWLRRVEAVLFASAAPVPRRDLAKVVGEGVALDALLGDLKADMTERAFDVMRIGDGWMLQTRPAYAAAIRAAARLPPDDRPELREIDLAVLAGIATRQPVTRRALAETFGREIGPEPIARLRARGLIAHGPRSPEPGAPRTFVTTEAFLATFSLRDLDALGEDDDMEP